MKLLVALDKHFSIYNGQFYTNGTYPYKYWKEYTDCFDSVIVLARIRPVSELTQQLRRADGPAVTFVPLPEYHGPIELILKIHKIIKQCFYAIKQSDAVLLRGGNVGICLWLILLIIRKPYAVEYGGAMLESIAYARQIKSHRINKLFAWMVHELHVIQARHAICGSYVSEYVHRFYHTRHPDREFVFSGVQLKDGLITGPRDRSSFDKDFLNIVSVGRLMPEKGYHILIEAGVRLRRLCPKDWKLYILGDGPQLEELRDHVTRLELTEFIELPGRIVWGPALFNILDKSQLFVLPSLTEGMPRAMIEAMARGLPAISTRAGGAQEILPEKYIVPPNDSSALAEGINKVLCDPDQLTKMSVENFETAMQYNPEILQKVKKDFWLCLRKYSK